MPQIIPSPTVYDVCVVGSGAAGRAAAKVLTEGGLNVGMLEAGPDLNPAKDKGARLAIRAASSRRGVWALILAEITSSWSPARVGD